MTNVVIFRDACFLTQWDNGLAMFSNLSLTVSTASASTYSADPVAFIIVGAIVLVFFLGLVIRILRRNRLKK